MATDSFLNKKSVLGLVERIPMCPPPETIVFSNNIQWLGSSLIETQNQHQYNDNISLSDVTNWELIKNLALGQSVACQITINGKREILPLFLTSETYNTTTLIKLDQWVAKGTMVLDDGKIAGVIMTYKYIHNLTMHIISEKLDCHVYIHYWGSA